MGVQTALVVDDSRSARYILQRLLEQRHIHVDLVDSAQQALSYLHEFRPDVVFMDDMMPGMDGHEAVEQLAADPKTQAIPIVMYTARDYAGEAPVQRRGVIGVLSKPFTPEDVNALLERLECSGDPRESMQPPAVPRLVRGAEPAVSGVSANLHACPTVAAAQTDKASPGIQNADALRSEMSAAVKAEVRLAVEQWLGETLENQVSEQIESHHASWRRVLNELRAEHDRSQKQLLEQRIPRLLGLLEQRLELRFDLIKKTLSDQIGNAGLGPLQRTQVASIVRSEAVQAAHRPARQAARQVAVELMRNDMNALNMRIERLRQRINYAMGMGLVVVLACASLGYLAGTSG